MSGVCLFRWWRGPAMNRYRRHSARLAHLDLNLYRRSSRSPRGSWWIGGRSRGAPEGRRLGLRPVTVLPGQPSATDHEMAAPETPADGAAHMLMAQDLLVRDAGQDQCDPPLERPDRN